MRAIPLFLAAVLWLAPAARGGPSGRGADPAATHRYPSKPQTGLARTRLAFPDGKSIRVDLAATPEQREIGLMNRTRLPANYGMLFVFPLEQGLEFWMKNTLVDLDMVFIGADKKITAVHQRVPRSTPDTPEDKLARRSGLAQYVLELPAGAAARHRLEIGQRLRFEARIPRA